MLIEFRVKNFKSIRDEQIFSMVASPDKEHRDTHVISGLKNCPDLLKSAVIYGPNASGKSNLIDAMRFVGFKVLAHLLTIKTQGQEMIERLPHKLFHIGTPFLLSENTPDMPSEFELSFWESGIRYQYGFTILREQIMEEWLIVYETSQPQKWFERVYDAEKQEYTYSTSKYLRGQKSVWQKATRPDALFLTTATALNSEPLQRIAYFILKQTFTAMVSSHPDYMMQDLHDSVGREDLLNFMKSADLGIEDIEFRREFAAPQEEPSRLSSPKSAKEPGTLKLFLRHSGTKAAWFPWEEESSGTRIFLGYAYFLFNALAKGCALVIDELDSNMHLLMLEHILKMFHTETNQDAQLIFTTHNVSLLDAKNLRRDQIWFTEKSQEGATELFSLAEFGARKGENYMRQYLSGAYGALPFFTDFSFEPKEPVNDAGK